MAIPHFRFTKSRHPHWVLLAGLLTADVLANDQSTQETTVSAEQDTPMTSSDSKLPTEPGNSPADPVDVPADTETNSSSVDDCREGIWQLTEAATKHRSGKVSYREEWTPILEKIVACLNAETNNQTCIVVRGEYDSIPFPQKFAATYGGQRAAQLARATARSTMVADKLRSLGVSEKDLRLVAPPKEANFRGATVTINRQCRSIETGRTVVLVMPEVQQIDENKLGKLILDKWEALEEKRSRSSAKPRHHGWFDAGFSFSPILIAPGKNDSEAAYNYFLNLGLGWHNHVMYLRMAGGGALGHPNSYFYAADFLFSIGYYRNPLIQIGFVGGMRHAWPEANPWLHRSWHVGFEGTQCFLADRIKFGELCARESISPLGRAITRLEVVNGELFQIDKQNEYAIRLEVAVLFRFLTSKRN